MKVLVMIALILVFAIYCTIGLVYTDLGAAYFIKYAVHPVWLVPTLLKCAAGMVLIIFLFIRIENRY